MNIAIEPNFVAILAEVGTIESMADYYGQMIASPYAEEIDWSGVNRAIIGKFGCDSLAEIKRRAWGVGAAGGLHDAARD